MDDWAANDPDFAHMVSWTDDPLPFGGEFSQISNLAIAHGTRYAGSKPAGLLSSCDRGKSQGQAEALISHPIADSWPPGATGLVLHTIVCRAPHDPRRIWVGISAAGVFSTEDGGLTWQRRNRLSNANACEGHDHPAAPRDGETWHCVHNMMHAGRERCALSAEQSRGLALKRWRTQLGRHERQPAFDLRVSDPGTSPRPRDGLDAATQQRHGGPHSSRCSCSGMADARRGRVMAGPAHGVAAEELLFHRASAGDRR